MSAARWIHPILSSDLNIMGTDVGRRRSSRNRQCPSPQPHAVEVARLQTRGESGNGEVRANAVRRVGGRSGRRRNRMCPYIRKANRRDVEISWLSGEQHRKTRTRKTGPFVHVQSHVLCGRAGSPRIIVQRDRVLTACLYASAYPN